MFSLTCQEPRCGKTFDAKSKRARFCGNTCRSRAHRKPTESVVLEGVVIPFTGGDSEEAGDFGQRSGWRPSGLTETVRKELLADNVVETSDGQAALILAARMEYGVLETGSSLATMNKELRATIEAAKKRAESKVNLVDQLAERRKRRQGAAAAAEPKTEEPRKRKRSGRV